jgi:WD40 repeat protein
VARLWDLAAAAPVGGVIAQDGDVLAAEFGPDGAVFATGGGDEKRGTGEARLWDAATGAPLGPPLVHQERVVAVAFGPDGLLATGSTDRTARLWDVATGRAVGPAVPIFRDPKAVEAVGFTPDGSRLLLAGANGVQTWPVPRPVDADLGRIRLWAEVIGGKSLDTGGSTRVLGSGEWWDRRRALDEHGNAPAADPVMIAPLFERRKRFRELQPRHFPVGLAGG